MNDVDFIDAKGRPLQIGSKVNHPTHGKGRVESERADGLMVRFDGGVKFLGANEVGSLVMESRPSPVIESLLRPMSPEDAFLRKWGEPGLREVREEYVTMTDDPEWRKLRDLVLQRQANSPEAKKLATSLWNKYDQQPDEIIRELQSITGVR